MKSSAAATSRTHARTSQAKLLRVACRSTKAQPAATRCRRSEAERMHAKGPSVLRDGVLIGRGVSLGDRVRRA
jgi:hypothetical protein